MTDEIRELAENGDAEAQIFLGRQYENEGDNEQAFCWYKRAAMQCNADGQYHLAELYFSLKEYTDEEAYQRAAFWYTKAANQGHAKAMSKLGCLYTDGFYIEPDYRRAIKLFAEALKQGNDEAVETAEDGLRCAQYGMGNQYYSQKKYSDALQWYQMAAEHGHVISQFKLGSMYEKGEGVDTDYSKAEYWYTKAAENGNAEAQHKLGSMYENGLGVEKNERTAYMWFCLSWMTHSYYNNENEAENIKDMLRAISEHISPDEAKEAEADARKKFDENKMRNSDEN